MSSTDPAYRTTTRGPPVFFHAESAVWRFQGKTYPLNPEIVKPKFVQKKDNIDKFADKIEEVRADTAHARTGVSV